MAVQRLKLAWLLVLLTTLLVAGCGSHDKWKEGRPKTYFTSGTVTLDGTPVDGAIVTFEPVDAVTGKPGTAVTDKNGYFEVQTFDPGDGLTEGKHKVAIRKSQLVDASGKVVTEVNSDAALKEKHLIPPRYSETKSSKLEVDIKQETNKLEPFALTK